MKIKLNNIWAILTFFFFFLTLCVIVSLFLPHPSSPLDPYLDEVVIIIPYFLFIFSLCACLLKGREKKDETPK
jgi:hypothetical protein